MKPCPIPLVLTNDVATGLVLLLTWANIYKSHKVIGELGKHMYRYMKNLLLWKHVLLLEMYTDLLTSKFTEVVNLCF